jgi:outer membrane protein TolC
MNTGKRSAVYAALIIGISVLVAAVPSGDACSARILSLRECVEIALANNPDVGMARQRLIQTESNVRYSYGSLLPNLRVDFFAGHRYYGPSSVLIDERGRPVQMEGFDYEDYTFRIGSDIILWDGGGNYARLKQSKQNRAGAREELEYNNDMMTAQVIRSYYNLVRRRMLLTVAEESEEQANRNLERTDALHEVGSATRADVLKASVLYSNTKLDLIRAANQVQLAREDLNALLNSPDHEEFNVDTMLTIEFEVPDVVSEIRFAVEHRSDLKGLKHYLESAESGVSVAKSGWLPTLGANFGYYWSDRQMADNLNFFEEEYQWNIHAFLSINIFDRFQTSTNVKYAKADKRIAEYNLEKYRLDAIKEIKSLILIIKEAKERISVATETVEQAKEDVRLAEERYRVGAGTMLDTVTAQVSLTQAKADVIDAKCDYLIAVADLGRATGRHAMERSQMNNGEE